MGEHDIIRIARAVGAGSLVLGAAIALTSCSALGAVPGGTAPSPDPSEAVATPTSTVLTPEPVASATPVATAVPTKATDGRTAVTPLITTPDTVPAGQALDVSALITSVIEGDGTCTITLTSGATEKTLTTPGVAASSYTACQAVSVKDLAAGTWQVAVRYSSDTAVGGAVKTVQVG